MLRQINPLTNLNPIIRSTCLYSQLYGTQLKINMIYCLFRIQEYESDCLFLFGAAPLQEQWPTRRAQVIIYKS